MAELHPQPHDPEEELYAPVGWAARLASDETIQSHTWAPSAEAILDSHSSLVDEFDDTVSRAKLTGGLAGTDYAWRTSVDTLDSSSRTQLRYVTVLIQVRDK
jgi:hypothetical protein